MKDNEKVRIQYSSKYANVSNYWKNRIGMSKALKALDIQGKKEGIEAEFTNWVNANPELKPVYGDALSLISESYKESDALVKGNVYALEAALTGSDITLFALRISRTLERMLNEDTPDAQKEALKEAIQEMIDGHFKNYDLATDKEVFVTLMSKYDMDIDNDEFKPSFFKDVKKGNFKKFAKKAYKKSIFVDKKKLESFLKEPNLETLKADPYYKVQASVYETYKMFAQKMQGAEEKGAKGNRLFVDGLRKMNPNKNYYPNANFTMRCTYGKVGRYKAPKDGYFYDYYTTLEGAIDKMDNTNPEFVIPSKLHELYKAKDYGRYADADGKLRVCFISDNDITGGNSGSPVINGNGELVGCAFDGNWEAMSGDIAFEDKMQRTISVDIRYVLFIIDKYAGAKHIVDEMTLVY